MKTTRTRVRAASRALLSWFDRHARTMEWRETQDPYRVWVSEIMLQQTTVAVVLPYYKRFLKVFPTVRDLARAPLDRVLKVWEGLGYYSRARNLHRAARILVKKQDGILPSTVEDLSALPGIGRSTAGAVASIAFGRDEPILDANVKRILARLEGIREDVAKHAVQKVLWDASRRFLLEGKGRETALALMDLGSLVCTPRKPSCPSCPLMSFCRARAAGVQEAIPVKAPRKAIPHHDVAVAVIRDGDGRIFIARRPGKGLLGGLWEFPGGIRGADETIEEALARGVQESFGAAVTSLGKIGEVRHAFSHLRVTLHAFRCRIGNGTIPPGDGRRWVRLGDLSRFAFPRGSRKIADLIAEAPSVAEDPQ
jgi:A/G-specific adenine glycosylase